MAKLSEDPKVIITALKKTNDKLIQVSDDNLKVRRNPDKTLKVVNFKELTARTLYVKGFPLELKVEDVLTFFEGTDLEYDNVFYRRDRGQKNKGEFKGSVYVTFKSDRGAMDFLSRIKNGDKFMYNDIELEVCSKEEHIAQKNADRTKNKHSSNDEKKERREQEKPKGRSSFSSPKIKCYKNLDRHHFLKRNKY